MNDSVIRAEASDESELVVADDEERAADVDETLAARRLRRWLQGMFGQRPTDDADPPHTP